MNVYYETCFHFGKRTANKSRTEYTGTGWETVYVRARKSLRKKDEPKFNAIHNPKVVTKTIQGLHR